MEKSVTKIQTHRAEIVLVRFVRFRFPYLLFAHGLCGLLLMIHVLRFQEA